MVDRSQEVAGSGTRVRATRPNTPAVPPRTATRLDRLEAAAHAAASHVKPSTLAAYPDEPLSARGLAVLAQLETELAWELR